MCQEFCKEALDYTEPVKLLNSIFGHLKLKEKPIVTLAPANAEEIDSVWDALIGITKNVLPEESLHNKSDLKNVSSVENFLDHCIRLRHYFFEIKCYLCRPVCSGGFKGWPGVAWPPHLKAHSYLYSSTTGMNCTDLYWPSEVISPTSLLYPLSSLYVCRATPPDRVIHALLKP